MRFPRVFTSVLALGCAAAHAIKSSEVTAAVKDLTDTSNELRIKVETITFLNAPSQGVIIAAGFSRIITKVGGVIPKLIGTPFPATEAKTIVQVFTTFVEVHKALLNVVIGKRGIVTLIPFVEPIRLSLVALEKGVDAFAFALIKLIPTEKESATKQVDSLKVTVTLAINVYGGKK